MNHDFERVLKTRSHTTCGEVDRVPDRSLSDKDLSECVLCRPPKLWDDEPFGLARVGCENERTTGVSDECNATSPGQRRSEQDG